MAEVGSRSWLTVRVVAREGECLAAGDDDVQTGQFIGHAEQHVRHGLTRHATEAHASSSHRYPPCTQSV